MPLTSKGEKIMNALKHEYGAEKGKHVFYAMRNEGKIRGVDKRKHHAPKHRHKTHRRKSHKKRR